MLVAQLDTRRIEAREAARGPDYRCPECGRMVILKKGRIVTHHFAHKPPVDCAWGRGESHAHREAKTLFRDEFARRGYRTEVEHEIASCPTTAAPTWWSGRRRARPMPSSSSTPRSDMPPSSTAP